MSQNRSAIFTILSFLFYIGMLIFLVVLMMNNQLSDKGYLVLFKYGFVVIIGFFAILNKQISLDDIEFEPESNVFKFNVKESNKNLSSFVISLILLFVVVIFFEQTSFKIIAAIVLLLFSILFKINLDKSSKYALNYFEIDESENYNFIFINKNKDNIKLTKNEVKVDRSQINQINFRYKYSDELIAVAYQNSIEPTNWHKLLEKV